MTPGQSGAEGTNPFLPGVAVETLRVFSPDRGAKPQPVLTAPLPPLPVKPQRAPETSRPPSASRSTSRDCPIEVSPAAPLVGAQGGSFVLQVGDAGDRGCIAGIETRDAWLKIHYFNGSELALYAEPNLTGEARRGAIYLANASNSLVLPVLQAPQ